MMTLPGVRGLDWWACIGSLVLQVAGAESSHLSRLDDHRTRRLDGRRILHLDDRRILRLGDYRILRFDGRRILRLDGRRTLHLDGRRTLRLDDLASVSASAVATSPSLPPHTTLQNFLPVLYTGN